MVNNYIAELLKRPIAYHPAIAKAFGSPNLAILWSQIYYWSDKTNNKDGWVYKSRDDLFDETGLTKHEQVTARKIGAKLGVLESIPMGQPRTVHFRVNLNKTIELITGQEVKEETEEKPKDKFGESIQNIFSTWNNSYILKHRKLTGQMETKIRGALRNYSEAEIKEAIEKYGKVVNNELYFWKYRWTLVDFLKRGLTRFLETPIENFLKSNFEQPKKKKRYYDGHPVVEARGKTWVIIDGEWKEFCGDPKEIIEKYE